MALAFGGAATATINSTAAITVSVPSGTVNGDLLLLCAANSAPSTYATPAGWNIINAPGVPSWVQSSVWWRIASSEPAAYTVTAATNYQQVATIVRYTGHRAATPIRASAAVTSSGSSATSPTPGALPGLVSGDWGVVFYGYGAGASGQTPTFTPPAGWAERVDIRSNSGSYEAALCVADRLDAASLGPATSTWSGHWGVSSVGIAMGVTAQPGSLMPFFM